MNWSKGITRVYVIFSVITCVVAGLSGLPEVILSAIGGCIFWYYAVKWIIRGFTANNPSQKAPENTDDTESPD